MLHIQIYCIQTMRHDHWFSHLLSQQSSMIQQRLTHHNSYKIASIYVQVQILHVLNEHID